MKKRLFGLFRVHEIPKLTSKSMLTEYGAAIVLKFMNHGMFSALHGCAVPCNVVTTNSKRQMEIRALVDRQKMILILEAHLHLGTKLEFMFKMWMNRRGKENCRLVTVGERQRWTKLQQIWSSHIDLAAKSTRMHYKSHPALDSLPKWWNNSVKSILKSNFIFVTTRKYPISSQWTRKKTKWARRTMMRWFVFCHSDKSNIQKYHGRKIKSSYATHCLQISIIFPWTENSYWNFLFLKKI